MKCGMGGMSDAVLHSLLEAAPARGRVLPGTRSVLAAAEAAWCGVMCVAWCGVVWCSVVRYGSRVAGRPAAAGAATPAVLRSDATLPQERGGGQELRSEP